MEANKIGDKYAKFSNFLVGTSFGAQMYDTAREAQIDEVAFISPMPGSTEFAVKGAYVSRIGDQVCGVSAFQIDGGNPHRI
jgi:hypothetical protein